MLLSACIAGSGTAPTSAPSASVSAARASVVPVQPSNVTLATNSPTAVNTPTTFGTDEAWIVVRRDMPQSVTVWRPTWLPDRYDATVAIVSYAHDDRYQVGYRTGSGAGVVFSYGELNGGVLSSSETVTINSQQFTIGRTPAAFDLIDVKWGRTPASYSSIQTSDSAMTIDEMKRIISGLKIVAN
jgi:hypothetical protein